MENEKKEEINVEASAARYCYLCYSILDSNKACTNTECPLYGVPQE